MKRSLFVTGVAGIWMMAGLALAQTPTIAVPNSTATTSYDAGAGFPDRNGPFSAILVVIPETELAEFNKPSTANRSLSRVARAEPGAKLAIKVLFTGPAGDLNSVGKVTMDLKILAPDGTIYANSDYKDLPVWLGSIGQGRGVFDNRDRVPVVTFEPKDKPGIYTIQATLRDRFSQRDIALKQTVELLPMPAAVTAPAAPPAQAAAADEAPKAAAPAKSKKKSRRKRRR
ncbi:MULTISPECIES: hypothetical protein [Asticcacaulis]|uniref:hypothetical protein n=1 Tax=Asticcacaulis TaxID=76890 RepID=UPI001AEB14A5|nr:MULTISPECIES: hypothetical protein [Asticcacaulis]MBP2158965.1 hypothetical protein [Asticcacaulis solisilvae]MDR6800010.1 hypothetical protein [Asticcacaulis sp. BE141]